VGVDSLDRRVLEKEAGFLQATLPTVTFETLTPFLKGFYLTLNSWREGRDNADWKVSPRQWKVLFVQPSCQRKDLGRELDNELRKSEMTGAPERVTSSPSLKSDVEALAAMFSPEKAPEVVIRSNTVITIVYGFGDASGTGLGATFTCGSGFNFRIGVWGQRKTLNPPTGKNSLTLLNR
jgi:hypothetical protein